MAKAIVRVAFRSPKEEEIRAGVRSYVYTVSKPLTAQVASSGYTISDGQTLNEHDEANTELSMIIANDQNDRLRHISYIEYCGTTYKASSVVVSRPRVSIRLGAAVEVDIDTLPKKQEATHVSEP
jgi:hypothetical protein